MFVFAPVVGCNAVLPGPIHTPLLEWAAEMEAGKDRNAINNEVAEYGNVHLLRRVGTPEEVANVAYFLFNPESPSINGANIIFE
ncbi:MAG: SDR family oxidoreductase [Thermoplasmatales archaeon]